MLLVVMSGLPGVGKSTLSRALARRLCISVLSVDPIETAIIKSGIPQSFATGLAAYEVAAALAEQNLRVRQPVLVDAVNSVEIARNMWRQVALRTGSHLRIIEVVCSDQERHQINVMLRPKTLPCTWEDVKRRKGEWEPWQDERLTLDSAASVPQNVQRMLEWVQSAGTKIPLRRVTPARYEILNHGPNPGVALRIVLKETGEAEVEVEPRFAANPQAQALAGGGFRSAARLQASEEMRQASPLEGELFVEGLFLDLEGSSYWSIRRVSASEPAG